MKIDWQKSDASELSLPPQSFIDSLRAFCSFDPMTLARDLSKKELKQYSNVDYLQTVPEHMASHPYILYKRGDPGFWRKEFPDIFNWSPTLCAVLPRDPKVAKQLVQVFNEWKTSGDAMRASESFFKKVVYK